MNITLYRDSGQEKITDFRDDIRIRVTKARESAGYNKKNFAKALGTRPSTVTDMESGKNNPSYETLLKIIEVTKCDPGWLLTGKEPVSREVSITGAKTDDYAMIPFEHETAAGASRDAQIEEEPVIVHRRLLARHHVSSHNCRAYRVRGQSMEPKLQDGDIVVCSMLQAGLDHLDKKGLYCVHSPEGITVKKVHYDSGGKALILVPLNPEYPLETIRLSETFPVLLGKVIGIWKDVD
ncbi:MAG: helix-turn-helix domain-containing protein [Nitrospinota bacterium]|nr:helix-turn-helix domain-containing protein [Nitrospinota bacterium]